MAFSFKKPCRGRVSGADSWRTRVKTQEEEDKKKKAKPRRRSIEPWIVSYIISLASLVPCATVG